MNEAQLIWGVDVCRLKRSDGWEYPLHGIAALNSTYDLDYLGTTWEVTLADLSDRTLDSVRVLRDHFADRLKITDTY